jgi:hypothetical protein
MYYKLTLIENPISYYLLIALIFIDLFYIYIRLKLLRSKVYDSASNNNHRANFHIFTWNLQA